MELERTEGEGDETIRIAISSESPVLRYDWWKGERYFEVLDHGPGGVDLSYARDGAPFLLDHNQRVQVGIVEGVKLDKDKKLRGNVRMGNHPDAAWVEKDLRSGIRKKISVGYDPGSNYTETKAADDKIPTRRYKGWRLLEASTVAVPADYDVGVARSAYERAGHTTTPQLERTMPGDENATATAGNPAPAVTRDHDAERKQRNATIANILALANEDVRTELTHKAMSEDWDAARASKEVFDANVKAATAAAPAGRVNLTDKEQREYSLARAIFAVAEQMKGNPRALDAAGFEMEISNEIAKKMKRESQGLWVPLELRADRRIAEQVRASVTGNIAGDASLGGAGVQTNVLSMIEMLRNEAILTKLGAQTIAGLTGNISFPRQTAANSWTWEGENPSTPKAHTAATLDVVTMTPHTGFGATAYSRQMVVQSSFSVEQFVRADLARIAALGIDAAGINGTSGGNEPVGILNLANTLTEVMGTHGGNLAWANIVSYETKLSQANAAQGRLAFLTTPGVRGKLKTTLKNTISGADYLWPASNELNGYPGFASNQVPSNLTKGTSTTICHGVVFGNWTELLIGIWGDALDLIINPFTYAKQGMIEVVENAMVDVASRHEKSFVVSKDVLV